MLVSLLIYQMAKLQKFDNILLVGPQRDNHFDTLLCKSLSSIWLWNPMDCSPPGSSVRVIFQARKLEWIVIPFSRGSSQPKGWTWGSYIADRFFAIWATREAQKKIQKSDDQDYRLLVHSNKTNTMSKASFPCWMYPKEK